VINQNRLIQQCVSKVNQRHVLAETWSSAHCKQHKSVQTLIKVQMKVLWGV